MKSINESIRSKIKISQRKCMIQDNHLAATI